MFLSLGRDGLLYIVLFGLLLNDLDFVLVAPIRFGGTFLSYLIISSFLKLILSIWVCEPSIQIYVLCVCVVFFFPSFRVTVGGGRESSFNMLFLKDVLF